MSHFFYRLLVRRPIGRYVLRAAALSTAMLGAGCDSGALESSKSGSSPGDLERGKQLLAQYQCGACHVIPGVPIATGLVGPPLLAFGRRSYIAGHLPNGPDMLTRWLVAPDALVPGTLMPAMGVAPGDARDMAAYLLNLK